MIVINSQISIDEDEIEESFIRSSGPGGQNVNKVETSVQIRFDARNCPTIPQAVYTRLRKLAGQRMTKDGIVVLTASAYRSQDRNRKAARDRLVELLRKAAISPKTRRATRPTYSSKLKRLESKQKRGKIKKSRGKVSLD